MDGHGKIVPARTGRALDQYCDWSSICTPSSIHALQDAANGFHAPSAPTHAPEPTSADWAPWWALTPSSATAAPFHPAATLPPPPHQLPSWGAAGAPRHDGLPGKPSPRPRSRPQYFSAPHSLQGWESPSAADRTGWKRVGARTSAPQSERGFDAEMALYESQLARVVSAHTGSRVVVAPVIPPVIPPPVSEAREMQVVVVVSSGSEGKRKRSECDQAESACGWVRPLKFLLRKILSMSDVGELGRIVLPKKDAEDQLPSIDTKEGKLLDMEDYTTSTKHWCFRYKWWINNKSRMYVLENTGDFIKYHSLKEHDKVILYEDGCGKLVVQAKKKFVRVDTSGEDALKGNANEEIKTDRSVKATPT